MEPIIRQGILKYKDQVGQLWTALADYYIRSGCFEKVREKTAMENHCSEFPRLEIYSKKQSNLFSLSVILLKYSMLMHNPKKVSSVR